MPFIYMIEDEALAVADTYSTLTVAGSTATHSDLRTNVRFTLKRADVAVNIGGTANRSYFIIRRVPVGYSAPTPPVADYTSAFPDTDNILAYGILNVANGAQNEMSLHILHPSVTLLPGDLVVFQAVAGTASAGQTYSSVLEHTLT
jgi:hypothetical protein